MKKKKLLKPPVATRTLRTPNGTIRKGDRVVYRKATNEMIEKRIEEVIAFYQAHPFATRFDLHKRFCKRWKLGWESIDDVYIPRARKLMAQRARFTPEEAREKSLGVVMRLLDHSDPKIALQAVKIFTEITGCEAPKRTEITGPGGGPILAESSRPLVDVPTERLRQLALLKGSK